MEDNRRPSQERETAFINRNERDAASRRTTPPADATQRVRVDGTTPPARRTPAPGQPAPRPAASQAQRRATAHAPQKKKFDLRRLFNDKVTLITLCSIAAVLLIAVIITLCVMFATPSDDGLILSNVYVAGVNVGGKTPEEAKLAIQEATKDTYTKLDMTIEVHDTTIILSPADTGAKLDVNAAVEAAYNYGRTGTRAERQKAKNQAATTSYTLPITNYLNLDVKYIQQQVDNLGSKYSSTLSQPKYRLDGSRPDLEMDPEEINTDTVYQTLYITLGTAEYGLDTEKLYDQIMEAYNTNLFQVVGEMTMVSPETLDLEALYAELCVAPVDALLDEKTYEVTPETYGYGFHIDEVRELLSNADYGDEIKVDMTFISPKVTEKMLTDGLFEKIIATYTVPGTDDKDLIVNLKLACREFPKDGLILKVDEEFSFNDLVGQLTESKDYREVDDITGKPVMGGGVSRISSALYYCALTADMEILERFSHTYAPDFIELGLDADIDYGTKDLAFQNTTGRPVRIEIDLSDDGSLKVDIWGTVNQERTVEILYETVNTYKGATLTSTMMKDNPGNYKAGDVLQEPITGYDVCTYRIYRYTGENASDEPVKDLIAVSSYAKQDKVVVAIQKDPEPTKPTQPDDTTKPSGSESSDPSESTGSSETTDPSNSTDSSKTTDPSNSTDPSDSTGAANKNN